MKLSMLQRQIFLIIFLILGGLDVFANQGLSCKALFESNESQYVCFKCYGNVHQLVQSWHQAGIDLTHTKVLFFYSRPSSRPNEYVDKIKPLKARSGHNITWNFHVVLFHKGLIYDYDFAPSPRNPVEYKKWAQEMWGPQLKPPPIEDWQRQAEFFVEPGEMHYKIIDAMTYLKRTVLDSEDTQIPGGMYNHWGWLRNNDTPAIERHFSQFNNDPLLRQQ